MQNTDVMMIETLGAGVYDVAAGGMLFKIAYHPDSDRAVVITLYFDADRIGVERSSRQ